MPQKSKGDKPKKVMHPHHILQRKDERKNVGDVVGFI
jgi:hypothetical protein